MAFDAIASSGGSKTRKGAGDVPGEDTGSLLSTMSQRVWNLVQALSVYNKLVDQVGTPADTTSLRQRIQAGEGKVEKMRADLDSGLRRLRVEAAEKGDSYTLKSVERLSDQYAEVRKQCIDSIRTSQAKQRQHVPSPDAPQDNTGGRVVPNRMRGGDEVAVEMSAIQLRALHDVDEAIAEEKRYEAAAIAQEAIAVNHVVRDIGGLVNQQGETLNKVEEHVDTTRENVMRANQDLMTAAKYQSSYRKKCIFFIVLVLILLAVVLIPILLHVIPSASS